MFMATLFMAHYGYDGAESDLPEGVVPTCIFMRSKPQALSLPFQGILSFLLGPAIFLSGTKPPLTSEGDFR